MDNREVLKGMRLRCECGGPVGILSTPPGGVVYGVCLCCGHWVSAMVQPVSADAVDPSAADPGNPPTRDNV